MCSSGPASLKFMPAERCAADVHQKAPGSIRLAVAAFAAFACLALSGRAGAEQGPLWLDGRTPIAAVDAALDAMGRAAEDGLEARDYETDGFRRLLRRIDQASDDDRRGFDKALTRALLSYLSDLRRGRIDPKGIHENYALVRPEPVGEVVLRTAVAEGRLAELMRSAVPAVPGYQPLKGELARYRALTLDPAFTTELPRPSARKLEPGSEYVGLGTLAARLRAFGDLPADAAVPARYEGVLVDAVRRFQTRHGLLADGVVGISTFRQLQMTPAQRVRQIELTLERLRWTPLMQDERMIVVNVPEYVLRAYDVVDGRIVVRQTMRVIVGKALDTRTPLFDEAMKFIEFSPYWNVPLSIARGEIVPRLRRDPGYLTREGMEFVRAGADVVQRISPQLLDAVLRGEVRIRQRPGPRNVLGDIKFVFPNNDAIYLHHTGSPRLFDAARRDFSHGCIRVEEPVALARFVLRDEHGWSESRIRESMAAGKSTTLRLSRPVPVLITYMTALVKDGAAHFYQDVYGHDRLLDAALRQRSKARRSLTSTLLPSK